MEYNGYNIVKDSIYPTMYRIEAIGRGSVHLALRGYYNSFAITKKAIESHLIEKGEGSG